MVASSIRFTQLLGDSGPVCHLLQVDGWTALLGCGWDEACRLEDLEPIIKQLKDVDAVILSYADPMHLGALPHLICKCGLSARVYSTLPVRRMGEMFMTELLHEKQAVSDFDVFTQEEVRRTFQEHPWTQLRYSQHFRFAEGKMAGVSLTPFNAGRMVGGTVWKIVLPDGSDVVYAVDWCHKKERHLNGATPSELSTRPALMIAGAAGCLTPSVSSLRRDMELLEVIMSTLRGDGSVLIPVDAAGRMLEMALLLDEFWTQEKLPYPLVVLSHTCQSVFDRAQQQLEWMSDHICAVFGTKRDNPFKMRCLQPLSSWDKLAHLPAGPKVVLACSPSLEGGFSRQLLLEWGADPKNTVCFMQHAPEGSLADLLQRHVPGPEPLELQLALTQRAPLQGPELEQYMRQLGQAVEVPEDPEEEEEEPAGQGLGGESPRAAAAAVAAGAGALRTPRGGSSSGRLALALPGEGGDAAMAAAGSGVLMDGFEPPAGCSYPMFPDEDEPMLEAWDAYGQVQGLPVAAPGMNAMLSLQMSADGVMMDVALEPGKAAAAAAAAAAEAAAAGPGVEEEEAQPEVPTKLVTSTVSLTIRAAIRFFDYSARPDGPILHKTLQDLAPRHLLLVQGSAQERADLAQHCRQALADLRTQVLRPARGEPLSLPLPPCFTLYLSDQLNESIRLQRMQRYALAQLKAVVGAPDPHHPPLLQLLPAGEEDALEDVFIADSLSGIQLSRIKKALADAGLESFFHAGRLVCGNVAISKGSSDKAHLVLEGALCEDFYKVREVIYSQYSVC